VTLSSVSFNRGAIFAEKKRSLQAKIWIRESASVAMTIEIGVINSFWIVIILFAPVRPIHSNKK
jgi:hypothetical protein